jgi:hypothetical protein
VVEWFVHPVTPAGCCSPATTAAASCRFWATLQAFWILKNLNLINLKKNPSLIVDGWVENLLHTRDLIVRFRVKSAFQP